MEQLSIKGEPVAASLTAKAMVPAWPKLSQSGHPGLECCERREGCPIPVRQSEFKVKSFKQQTIRNLRQVT